LIQNCEDQDVDQADDYFIWDGGLRCGLPVMDKHND
jgi:hypothetical protein